MYVTDNKLSCINKQKKDNHMHVHNTYIDLQDVKHEW